MEKVSITIILEASIKESGFMIKSMDMVLLNMSTVINMKGIGKMDRDQDKEFMNIQMAIYTKENGQMT